MSFNIACTCFFNRVYFLNLICFDYYCGSHPSVLLFHGSRRTSSFPFFQKTVFADTFRFLYSDPSVGLHPLYEVFDCYCHLLSFVELLFAQRWISLFFVRQLPLYNFFFFRGPAKDDATKTSSFSLLRLFFQKYGNFCEKLQHQFGERFL